MKKVVLIINPSSGGEKAREYEALAKEKLESLFDTVQIRYTKKSGDAKKFARTAAAEQYDSVIVMGGDGTVNEGISGLAEQEYRPKFGFFPLGTVNDLARALSIPLDPKEAIGNFSLDETTMLDIGKINQDYFMNVVAVGTIPEAINDVDSEDKTKLGKFAYFISGMKQLLNTQSHVFHLTIDNQEKEITSSTILIGLTNSIGGFEQLLPEAKVNDGLLHLVYLKDQSLVDTVKSLPDLVKGVQGSTENVGYLSFKELRLSLVHPNESLTTNIDGDEGDALPIDIGILPSHLTVYKGAAIAE